MIVEREHGNNRSGTDLLWLGRLSSVSPSKPPWCESLQSQLQACMDETDQTAHFNDQPVVWVQVCGVGGCGGVG